MEADRKKLLKRYADNLERSENKNHYLKYAEHFLETAEGLDRISIDRYLEDDLRKKYCPGTVNFAFRVIRRLFAVNELPWEYRQGEAPVIGQRDEYRPQLSLRVIQMMIGTAVHGRRFNDRFGQPQEVYLNVDEKCFLALSTIYGLRREELADLHPEDIDIRSGAIYVATVKSGRERYHLIPREIKPHLAAHDFSKRYAVATVSQMFKRILVKSGAGELKKLRLGWHAIRRPLVDGLDSAGVSVLDINAFLRWKSAGRGVAMPARYHGNVEVDLDETGPVVEEGKGDEEIFEKHPFLPLWRENA